MNITALSAFLQERLKGHLPGIAAHELMRARPAGSASPRFDHATPPRPGSVLILLYEVEGETFFPLIRRPEYVGAHGGQVSLPGGKAEPGEDFVETALREAEEEIGIDPETVQVLGKLSEFHVVPSNYLVTPVVGVLNAAPEFIPDPFEVAGIISCRVHDLMDLAAIKEKQILAAGKWPLIAPHFEIESQVVWGATAMILNEFRSVLQELTR